MFDREIYTDHINQITMSREAYTAPNTRGSGQQQGSGSNPFTQISAPNAFEDSTARPVQYLCGDCDSKVMLKRGDPIRCKECGYRILYKERTNRLVGKDSAECMADM